MTFFRSLMDTQEQIKVKTKIDLLVKMTLLYNLNI